MNTVNENTADSNDELDALALFFFAVKETFFDEESLTLRRFFDVAKRAGLISESGQLTSLGIKAIARNRHSTL